MGKIKYCEKRIYTSPKDGRRVNVNVDVKLRYYYCTPCSGYHATKSVPYAVDKYNRLNRAYKKKKFEDSSLEKLEEYYVYGNE
ncbi:MAG: hypothetical protein KAQ85_00895 [Thermodesulfovibrionia bacterium]|nr:hypothetical protein [Thermodesulfovibrionia bacterium]